ncbi:MAG: ABC transporter ATP-binding protein [Desulfobacterales bacterium]
MPIIDIDTLCFRYPDGTLGLERISLGIEKGTLVVITGPNGSGKTTLLKHLNGLLRSQSGTVRIDGVTVASDLRRARRLVGMIFQDADSQIVGETVAADVAFGPENLSLPAAEVGARVDAALETVGLTTLADQTPQALSGGEKRRLSIAGVLAMHPQIVVFDEPLAGLDFPGTRQVLREMLRLQEAGHTLVVATHDLEKIIYHADRLIVMNGGHVVRDGPPGDIVGEIESFGVRAPCVSRLGLEAESWLT